MSSHSKQFTPGRVIVWTMTIILCSFCMLFAVLIGAQIAQFTFHMLENVEYHTEQPEQVKVKDER